MNRFENTLLWQRTLAIQNPDTEKDQRARLLNAFEKFRERATILAGEIAHSLPEFTVHDISHIDALWEMAQLVAGDDFPLTPTEAFVLGGAFLVHDLGMGLAAYPDGIDALRREQLWKDSVASLLKAKLERSATPEEIEDPGEEIEKQATRIVLRELHAKQASRLALTSWKDKHNPAVEYYLIDDLELRLTYGPIIGQIAHSHWWSINELSSRLRNELGAPAGFSNDWTVDPIKLACLLRAADASHLDERRAPGFLRVLRGPSGVGRDHWTFQEKLYQPRRAEDRLEYTSKSSFTIQEADAWWLCFDALQVVDRELRHVDALLADSRRPRLQAKRVSDIEEPKRLANLIETDEWEPVDAKVRVGNVAKLVANLGGSSLYGDNVTVPLRELIQNASDAVIARRLIEGRPPNWGDVYVRYGNDENGSWIEVEDTGIGMSVEVLTGPFLDFGTSFWGSDLMHRELPGLESKNFSSTGKYGIGFFSVFMWGERVQIFTRRPDQAHEDTWVLQFDKGLTSRPILRKARLDEYLRDGGTRMRIILKDPTTIERLLSSYGEKPWTLAQKCAWLCPSLDVNLYVENKGKIKKVIAAADWVSISGMDLLKRIIGPSNILKKPDVQKALRSLGSNLKYVKSSTGEIIGRACIIYGYGIRLIEDRGFHRVLPSGIVTLGGIRSSNLHGFSGILIGTPYTASRDIGIPVADRNIMKQWSSEQARLINNYIETSEDLSECAAVIAQLGGNLEYLPVARSRKGWVSIKEISELAYLSDEVLLVQDAALINRERQIGEIILHENVLAVSMGSKVLIQSVNNPSWIPWPVDPTHNEDQVFITLSNVVIDTIAATWGTSVKKVMKISEFSGDDKSIEREIGFCNGNSVTLRVNIIKRHIK